MNAIHAPADQKELVVHAQAPHGHEEAAYGHALAEAHYHARFGQALAQLPQEAVKLLLASVAVDLVRVGDAQALLGGQLLEGLHAALAVVPCGNPPESTLDDD